MATFRVGVGSFNVKDGAVGIGTEASGHGKLKVEGTTRTSAIDIVGGASTFTRYSGFSANEISVNDRFGATNPAENKDKGDKTNVRTLELTKEVQTTGKVVVDNRTTLSVGLGSTACLESLEYVCVKHHFSLPSGDTLGRDISSGYVEGTIRYNTDLGTMEFFNGSEWRQFTYITDVQNSPRGRGRGVFGGGGPQYTIDYLNIASTGNTMYFGDLSTASGGGGDSAGGETRGILSGHGPNYRAMQYVTFASEGRTISFGDSTYNSSPNSSTKVCNASSTRFLNMGDYLWTNTIDYVEIATVGNAVDFGDLLQKRAQGSGFASSTRAMYCGGYRQTSPGGNVHVSDIDMVKFSSLGDATNFGDLTKARKTNGCATSNSVRGIIGGGTNPSTDSGVDIIEFVTLASEGTAIDFGSFGTTRRYGGCAANQNRAVWRAGAIGGSTYYNTIYYISIASGGNALDFGDVAGSTNLNNNGMSDSHGGLGGY